MPTDKDHAREIIGVIERSIPQCDILRDDDLKAQFSQIKEIFENLLKEPFIMKKEFNDAKEKFIAVSLELQKRNFERSLMLGRPEVIFDTDPAATIYSYVDRESGEKDLYKIRDSEQLEEAYMFIKYKKGDRVETIWIEIGDAESEMGTKHKPLGWIAGVLKKYGEEGPLLEVSFYHTHPGSVEGFRISLKDIFMYLDTTRFLETYGFNLKVDMRAVNSDGIYTLSGVNLAKIEKLPDAREVKEIRYPDGKTEKIEVDALFVIGNSKGQRFVDLMKKYGADCSYNPRKIDKVPAYQ